MTNTTPTRTMAWLSSAAPLMILACVLGAPSVARAQTAEEIVAANIKASGGEQAIARIGNFTSKGRVTVESPLFGRLEGTLDAVRVPGHGYYEHVVLGPIEQTKGWDGTRGWGSWGLTDSGRSKASDRRYEGAVVCEPVHRATDTRAGRPANRAARRCAGGELGRIPRDC